MNKPKFFVFSDESGSWHNQDDVYVRAWVVVPESTYQLLTNTVSETADLFDANELKWNHIAHNAHLVNVFSGLDIRIVFTVSCCKNIDWDNKYHVTRNFEQSFQSFDFGTVQIEVVDYIKDRIYRDIKHALFVNYYEKCHIQNAKEAIESVIRPTKYDLIYRVDPPQLSQDKWGEILKGLSEEAVNLEFPKSTKSHGIQLADVCAGALRSIILSDDKVEVAREFLKGMRGKLISPTATRHNPNLIFFQEMDEELIKRCRSIWSL